MTELYPAPGGPLTTGATGFGVGDFVDVATGTRVGDFVGAGDGEGEAETVGLGLTIFNDVGSILGKKITTIIKIIIIIGIIAKTKPWALFLFTNKS
ncbi:MAG TPA: hypothetical protein VKC53_03725 [Patescibacteria group bacterium]|nr:hypothetical protein [Patescibacteria group bacterium]